MGIARGTIDADEFVERCRGVAPLLADHAVDGERDRRVPEQVLAAVGEADLLRALVPRSLGGHELGLAAVCEGTRELANGCPASAWTVSFLMLHAWMLGRFPEARADLFATDPAPTAAAPLAPTGTVTPVDGGFRVSGRWEWATAVHHADWVMVHGIDVSTVGDGSDPGAIVTRFALVPVADATIEDVWDTAGMRATGSDTVVVDDVFVPSVHTVVGADLRGPDAGVADDPLAGLPMLPVLALVASAPAVGAAEAAVTAYRTRVAERVLAYSVGDRAADQPTTQARVGAVRSDLATTVAGWRHAIDSIAAVAAEPGGAGDLARVDARLAAAAAVRSARRIIGDVGEGAGASVYFADHPHQRLQRDVETLKGHVVFDWDRTTELAGRVAVGHPLRPTDLA